MIGFVVLALIIALIVGGVLYYFDAPLGVILSIGLVVLLVGVWIIPALASRSLPLPQTAPGPTTTSTSADTQRTSGQAPSGPNFGGACRSTDNGKIDGISTFSSSADDFIQVDYWTNGNPERSVLLDGGTWSRPSGMGGTYWVWIDCTEAQAREQVEESWNRRRQDGANVDGWGDPSLFSRR